MFAPSVFTSLVSFSWLRDEIRRQLFFFYFSALFLGCLMEPASCFHLLSRSSPVRQPGPVPSLPRTFFFPEACFLQRETDFALFSRGALFKVFSYFFFIDSTPFRRETSISIRLSYLWAFLPMRLVWLPSEAVFSTSLFSPPPEPTEECG